MMGRQAQVFGKIVAGRRQIHAKVIEVQRFEPLQFGGRKFVHFTGHLQTDAGKG